MGILRVGTMADLMVGWKVGWKDNKRAVMWVETLVDTKAVQLVVSWVDYFVDRMAES